jgi:hypothetical protein
MTLHPILRIMNQHVATNRVFLPEFLWLYYGNLRNLNRVKKIINKSLPFHIRHIRRGSFRTFYFSCFPGILPLQISQMNQLLSDSNDSDWDNATRDYFYNAQAT